MENQRICKRCLTRELADSGEVYCSIREYIENMDKSLKVSDVVYEERLNVCKACEMLLAGMCRVCGCYVEMRAVVTKNSCPRKKW